MELALGGDLFNLIETDGVEPDIAHFYFRQLINGVDYLHSRGVAHRDIKPENLLLDENGNLKIADFGLAALFRLPTGKRRMCYSACGSMPYVAPEVIADGYDPDRADIWSCGVVLFVLLCGQMPWDEPTKSDVDFKNYCLNDGRLNQKPWNTLPLEALSLLRCVLKLDIKQRFTMADIRMHPWFTRPNPFMMTDGNAEVCNDPNELATRLLMNLQIDLSDANYSATQQAVIKQFPSTLPLPADRTPPLDTPAAFFHAYSSQQPVKPDKPMNQKEKEFLENISKDPVQLQFQRQGVFTSMSQQLRHSQKNSNNSNINFKDMFYNRVLTRFYSVMPLETIVPILGCAFHQLGIDVRISRDPMAYANKETVNLSFMAQDRRRGLLRGVVQCNKLASSTQFVEVSFVRSGGDQVEWRHLFKKVVLLCRDSVYISEICSEAG